MALPPPKLSSKLARFRLLALALFATIVAVVCTAWYSTMRAPAVRSIDLDLPGLGSTDRPLHLVLLSDIHVSGPDMPPSRVQRIVDQVNALEPDIVMIAGDIVSDKRLSTRHYSTAASVAPLAKLRARLGKVAVPGNHDHWRGILQVRQELEKAGFTVLQNRAAKLGPLVVGGLDDDFTGHANLPIMLKSMADLKGPGVILSHSPDPFANLPSGPYLMLAGHTHCGQVRYPWGGTPATMSRYGDRYACGQVRERGNTLLVTAGLGTSVLPFRFLALPDVWRIKIEPPDR